MADRDKIDRVSIHGGHSGQFCLHARDQLEEIVLTYIEKGFCWVGLTEHMPPVSDAFRYADEVRQGITAEELHQQFGVFVAEARRLQAAYRDRIQLFVAMESEWYPGSQKLVQDLREQYHLDYIVGSVHHVRGVNFDFSPTEYERARDSLGGMDALYAAYFDDQLAMIEGLRPEVVGHFDLVRLYDPEYPRRLQQPEIARRMTRNLLRIRELDLCLDLNMRALDKGASEPYLSRPLLREALELGIAVVPGDDSHGVASVGSGIDRAIELLTELGGSCRWRQPTRIAVA
ncbi:MAG: histidinol-phosphatase [Desulfuromonadaceae bacterium]|nr:histidinol-phosphatase [Desulfuromonadaceae bacterium]